MDQRWSGVFLAIFFALAWLPFGQQDFMVEHWMKVGAFVAPILLFMAFRQRGANRSNLFGDVSLMASVFAAAYLLHQVEEHWVDLLGREYPLYDTLNRLIANVAGDDKFGVMTPQALFYINAGTVWTIAFLAILASPRLVFPALAMAALMFVNAVAHIVVGIVQFGYNSGLATSIILFLPLTLLYFHTQLRMGRATWPMVTASLFYGVVGHFFLFAGLFAANVYGVVPVGLYYLGLIGYGVLPMGLFRPSAQ